MRNIYWFLGLALIFFLSSCTDRKDYDDEQDADIQMFVNDSIDLLKYFPHLNKNSTFSKQTDLFGLYKGKLFVKDLLNIRQKKNYQLAIDGHNISVNITFWITNKYSLELADSDSKYRILLTKNDTTFFLQDSKLYYSIGNMNNKTFCADLPYNYPLYTEMVAEENMYAYRTFGLLLVSNDLKNWKRIYSDKRGIKSSMVIVGDKRRLLFTEYSPGQERLRHHIYSYSFDSGKLEKNIHSMLQQKL